ncbi:MAG: aminopeptidase [Defluviitaleaceae bacterium]|nr:aminopeptidase [Defluviitaleaceae bacterium]
MDKKLIEKLVAASGVKSGELVLVHFWGEDADIGIMHSIASTVAAMGASPVEMQQSRSINAQKFVDIKDGAFCEKYFSLISNFDAVIDIFSYRPVAPGETPKGFQADAYRKYMSNFFNVISKAKRFTQIRIPTEENAKESNLPYEEYRDRMLYAMDIDYDVLHKNCEKTVGELDKKAEITLVTGDNHKLYFDLTGRKWFIDAGDGDSPAGEVYIAPMEGKTKGNVFFKTLFAGCWGKFDDVLMTIEDGKIVSTNCDGMNERLSELDDASKTICELAFGQNPNISELCGYTVLDEKAKGTFHIGIGNNTMFGGENDVPFHMDYVGTGTIL